MPAGGDPLGPYVRAVGLSAVVGLLLSLASVAWIPGWRGAALGVGQGAAICLALLVARRNPADLALVLFGLAAGVAELPADAWLVRHGGLVYPPGPRIWASPAYMPVAWLGMLSGGLALAAALRHRASLPVATLLVAVGMGLWVPLFEALARLGGWWWYEGDLLFGAVPAYIVAGEVGLALPLAGVVRALEHGGPGRAVALGLAQGAWIFICYRLALWVFPVG